MSSNWRGPSAPPQETSWAGLHCRTKASSGKHLIPVTVEYHGKVQRQSFRRTKHFSVFALDSNSNPSLAALLTNLEGAGTAYVIRGATVEGPDRKHCRRLMHPNGCSRPPLPAVDGRA